ncbi:MAG: metallophosphoesterase family protein [Myxococcales bacterium]|nr:metallophosphoesterase family protein [Myxococcales bacterium]MDD9969086.1 metallophosphoesterase family protein [Myxococcales bacterium]
MGVHRLALISDIHGNAIALRAVLAHARRAGIERIVCLGDVATLGPDPGECIALVRENCDTFVMGNHETYLLHSDIDDDHLAAPSVRSAVAWCRERVSARDLRFLSEFQDVCEIPLGAHHKLLLYHGSPRSNTEDLLATTEPTRLDEALGDTDATLFAGGHTHVQMLRQHRGRWVLNAGSVGMPFVEAVSCGPPTALPFAEYCHLEVEGEHARAHLQRVALDRAELIDAARAWRHPLGDELVEMYTGYELPQFE